MKVLVVDDSAAIRARLVAMLREVAGTDVHEAADAEEALSVVLAGAVDLVVLDVHMPGRSGLEVLPRMKAIPSPPFVVVLTGHPTEHHRRQSIAMGADLFLDKSRDFDRVLELVTVRRG